MSGRKNALLPIADSGLNGVSMAASHLGTPFYIQYMDNIGIQLVWTGATPGGTINVQVSLDYNPNTGLGNWTFLQNSGTNIVITPAGTPDNGYFDLNQLSASYIRTIYTTAGGSVGSLTATYSAKML